MTAIRSLSVFLALAFAPLAVPPMAQGQNVSIYYDDNTLPHVFGDTDEAALYGLGYQQMRDFPIGTLDRLWRFSGRFSEVAGPSYLDRDYDIRLWDVPAMVTRDRLTLPSDIRDLLNAYVAGVEAGRAWWRNGQTLASRSPRVQLLLGTNVSPDNVELNVDPLPDYLNQGFHPYQFLPDGDNSSVHPDYAASEVPRYIASVVDRLFDPANPITIEHVLSLGLAYSSTPSLLYRAAETRFLPDDDGSNSKGWALSSSATGGNVVMLQDGHTTRESLTSRPYLGQIHGDNLQIGGLLMPGFPAPYIAFNDSMAWTGAGSGPNSAVIETTWGVTLESGTPLRFRFGGSNFAPKLGRIVANPGGAPIAQTSKMRLEIESDAILYFDPVASQDTNSNGSIDPGERVFATQTRQRYYAPANPALGLVTDRHPVLRAAGQRVDGIFRVPAPGQAIEFEQAAFGTAANTWEFLLRLGRARHIDDAPPGSEDVLDVLQDGLWGFDNNLIFADHKNRFYALYMAHVPIQGAAVRQRGVAQIDAIANGNAVLDGAQPDERWRGFHSLAALPQIGPATVNGPEAWIATVGTLDGIETGPSGTNPNDDRFRAQDLANYAPEILRPTSTATFAYLRAIEVLKQTSLTPGALNGVSEVAGVDVTDQWMVEMWDFFRKARDIRVVELGPQPAVDSFLDFVEAYRHLGEDGLTCDPNLDFFAHEYSVVTTYTTLLRARYGNELVERSALTNALQASFGADARHPLFSQGTGAFDRTNYSPNVDAMWEALVDTSVTFPGTVSLYGAGTGSVGLANPDVLANQWGIEPWASEARFQESQAFFDANTAACASYATGPAMAGSLLPRWGHVNMLCLTPHFFPPPRAVLISGDPDRFRAHLYSGLRPDLLGGLDPAGQSLWVSRFKFPVYENQTVRAFPIRGVEDSLFPTSGQLRFSAAVSPSGYSQAVHVWNKSPDDYFYFAPHEKGAQLLLGVEFLPGPRADVRFMSAVGATEITRAFQGYQQRYAPSENFARGVWDDFETDETVVAGAATNQIDLTYTP